MGVQPNVMVVVHQREPFLRGFSTFLRDVWASRPLLFSFVRKELLVRYRQSALGVLWAMAKPFTQLLIYGLVLGVFLGMGQRIPAFGFYIFCGIIMISIFTESATNGATSIQRGAPLVKKVAFRRELLPMAAVGGALINSFFQVVVLSLAYVVTREGPNWSAIGFVVPALLIVTLFALGTAFLLGALNVYARDVQFLTEVGLMVLFWMTPIVYPWTLVRDAVVEHGYPTWLFEVYMLNPLTNAVIALREALWPGADSLQGAQLSYFDSPLALRLWLMVLAGAVFVWFAQRVFARLQVGFATEL